MGSPNGAIPDVLSAAWDNQSNRTLGGAPRYYYNLYNPSNCIKRDDCK